MSRTATPSERCFRLLLLLFPRSFRARFGADMRDVFRDQLCDAHTRAGLPGIARLWLRTLPALMGAALLERAVALRDHTHVLATHTRSDGMLEMIMGDVRFAGRMLRKSPVFAAAAVLVISLGTGAVTTLFSAVNAVLLRPLPATTHAARLVGIQRAQPGSEDVISASYAYYRAVGDRARTLDAVAAWSRVTLSIASDGEGTTAYGNIVSGNYFSVLGVRPVLGRFFAPDEDVTPLTHPVLVVSEAFWQSRLGADPSVIGKSVTVNGHPYTIIGVAPAEFRGVFTPLVIDAWVPLMMQQQLRPGRDLADAPWLWMFGRLKDRVSQDGAQRDVASLTAAYASAAAEPDGFRTLTDARLWPMTGLPPDARRAALGFMSLLFGAAVLVLLIASVNVASMLSARAVARRREMALRSALGAGRARLVRQLLTESLVLFLAGAIGGLAVAQLATRALEGMRIPGDVAVSLELSPDVRVLVFSLTISLLTGVVFGLAPALQAARKDIALRLRDQSAGAGTRRAFLANALIVGQLALSLVLLVVAGLFVRALELGARVDPGFDRAHVATAALNTESWGYDETEGRAFFRTLRERIGALPGVTAASYSSFLPLTMSSTGGTIEVDGTAGLPIRLLNVDTDYFDAVRIPLVSGRAFDNTDGQRAPKVAVINETLARRIRPDGSALGLTFGFAGERFTIVGVARDAKYAALDEATPPFAYFSLAQRWLSTQTLLVRTGGDPESIAPGILQAVRSIDAALPLPALSTLQAETSIVLLPQRVAAMVTGALGAMGLLLATVGLYGIITYSTGRRTREIGLRVALGARRSDVLRMIIREGVLLAGTGVAIGLLLAAATTRLVTTYLFGVHPLDGLTFAAVSALFITIALVASWLPARRAATADPMVVLKTD